MDAKASKVNCGGIVISALKTAETSTKSTGGVARARPDAEYICC
jgi:hypothetical protein